MKWLVSGISSVLSIILECVANMYSGVSSVLTTIILECLAHEMQKWLVSGVSFGLTIILECIAHEMVG